MGKTTDFLYLSETDMIKAGVLNSVHCVDVIDEVFHLLGTGDNIMGGIKGNEHGLKINFPKETPFPSMPVAGPDKRFMSMVAYLGGRFNVCGEKWYGSNHGHVHTVLQHCHSRSRGTLSDGSSENGAQNAAILSTFEPLTSLLIGVLFLSEPFSFKISIGVVMILLSVLLLTKSDTA